MDWIYGKTVLVTGASSGLGRALSLYLIREQGCKVMGIGQSEEKMKSVKEELAYLQDYFTYRIFDVSVEENWHYLADELVSADINIDILINNAGILPPFDKAANYTENQIKRCMDVNFNSCRYSINALLPILRKSTMAGIVNVSSADVFAPLVGTSIYSASKAALKAYTEVLIGELGREMYIGYVCPGFIRTDIFRNQYYQSDSRLIRMASSKVDKVVRKLVKKIIKQKSRIIIGKDAKIMNFTSKFFPVLGLKFYEQIIKTKKIEMFENIR